MRQYKVQLMPDNDLAAAKEMANESPNSAWGQAVGHIAYQAQLITELRAALKEGLYLVDTQNFEEPDDDKLADAFIAESRRLLATKA